MSSLFDCRLDVGSSGVVVGLVEQDLRDLRLGGGGHIELLPPPCTELCHVTDFLLGASGDFMGLTGQEGVTPFLGGVLVAIGWG